MTTAALPRGPLLPVRTPIRGRCNKWSWRAKQKTRYRPRGSLEKRRWRA
jgi:hypothetical protein